MRLTSILLVLALCAPVAGQEPLRFDAASIKPAPPRDDAMLRSLPRGPGMYSVPSATLIQMVGFAYQLQDFRVIGGPDWIRNDRFQVIAKTDAAATLEQRRAMVQQLLAERFRLRVHRETRELPTYDLVFARGDRRPGPGLVSTDLDCRPFQTGARPMSEAPKMLYGGREVERCATVMLWSMKTGAQTPNLRGQPVTTLLTLLENALGRVVADKTGLTGLFDFDLTYVDPRMAALPGMTRPSEEGPQLMTVLPERLGLKLESSRGPVELLVIDAAEPPTPN